MVNEDGMMQPHMKGERERVSDIEKETYVC